MGGSQTADAFHKVELCDSTQRSVGGEDHKLCSSTYFRTIQVTSGVSFEINGLSRITALSCANSQQAQID